MDSNARVWDPKSSMGAATDTAVDMALSWSPDGVAGSMTVDVVVVMSRTIPGLVLRYDWGDGTTTDAAASDGGAAHGYTTPGEYMVAVAVVPPVPPGFTIAPRTVMVTAETQVVTIGLVGAVDAVFPLTVNLTAVLSHPVPGLVLRYTFGDGTTDEVLASAGGTAHTYKYADTYTLGVAPAAPAPAGFRVGSDSDVVIVEDAPPTGPTGPVPVVAKLAAMWRLTDDPMEVSITAGTKPKIPGLFLNFDFGDMTAVKAYSAARDVVVPHTYGAPGNYVVTISPREQIAGYIVGAGALDVTAREAPPTGPVVIDLTVGWRPHPDDNMAVYIDTTMSDLMDNGTTLHYDFGDGTDQYCICVSTDSSYVYKYAVAGNYEVTVTPEIRPKYTTNPATVKVTARPTPPTDGTVPGALAATWRPSQTDPMAVYIEATLTPSPTDGCNCGYDFGDGTTNYNMVDALPVGYWYQYPTGGTYTVTITPEPDPRYTINTATITGVTVPTFVPTGPTGP